MAEPGRPPNGPLVEPAESSDFDGRITHPCKGMLIGAHIAGKYRFAKGTPLPPHDDGALGPGTPLSYDARALAPGVFCFQPIAGGVHRACIPLLAGLPSAFDIVVASAKALVWCLPINGRGSAPKIHGHPQPQLRIFHKISRSSASWSAVPTQGLLFFPVFVFFLLVSSWVMDPLVFRHPPRIRLCANAS